MTTDSEQRPLEIPPWLTPGERKILAERGAYCDSLVRGTRTPKTDEERHFLAACRGGVVPATELETAYLKREAWKKFRNEVSSRIMARKSGPAHAADLEACNLAQAASRKAREKRHEERGQQYREREAERLKRDELARKEASDRFCRRQHLRPSPVGQPTRISISTHEFDDRVPKPGLFGSEILPEKGLFGQRLRRRPRRNNEI